MCFSATASFVVASGLSLVGLLSLRLAKTKEQYPLAISPFLFAMQQAAEGVVWLTINNPAYQTITMFAMMVFLVFAMVFWPLWVPIALFILEKHLDRKKILLGLCICGAVVAGYSYYQLFFFPVNVQVCCSNLLYFIKYNRILSPGIYLLCYFIPTVASLFVSSFSFMWLFGFFVTGALLLSYLVWYATLISVWCFFAAVLSAVILVSFYLHKD